MTQRVEPVTYEQLFTLEPERLEAEKQGIAELAFKRHLAKLGELKDNGVDYLSGNTFVSVPAYFKEAAKSTHMRFQTLTNIVALGSLPLERYQAGYPEGSNILKAVHFEASRRGNSAEDAIRHGKAAEWLVGQTVHVTHEPATQEGRILSVDIVRGLNDSIVMPLPVMASRVMGADYKDFLDYLVDAKLQLNEIVNTIFEHGPPHTH